MNKVVNIHGLDAKINSIQTEILRQHSQPTQITTVFPDPDGMDTNELSYLVTQKMSSKDLKDLTKLITRVLEKMAIAAKVTYDSASEYFVLDFRIKNVIYDDKLYGKIVHINPQEILFHKCTYQQPLEASVIAVLIYTLVQKEEVTKC